MARKSGKGKLLIIMSCVVVGVVVLLMFGLRRTSARMKTEETATLIPVEVVTVKAGYITENARVPVTLNPFKEAALSFKLGGRVKEVCVELGAIVTAGTTLAKLDVSDLENQIRQAQAALAVAEANLANLKAGSRPENVAIYRAQLQQAEANMEVQRGNYERQKTLYAEALISQQQLEAATASYQAAQAQVNVAKEGLSLSAGGPSAEMVRVAEAQVQQARVAKEIAESQRENLRIVAPFSGCVTMVKVNQGEMASPGLPVLGLADLSKVYATGFVGQEIAVRLRTGEQVRVKLEAGGAEITLSGRIVAVGQTVDPVLRTYQVKVLCDRGGNQLMGGMMGEALFAVGESGAGHPVLPREALVEEGGRTFVYVVENGRAVIRDVKLGVDSEDRVEIVSGLRLGEQVVRAGQHLLQDGVQVEVK